MNTPDDVRALYRTLGDEYLALLRRAFEHDKQHADGSSPVTPEFCDGRIAIIDEILKERRKT